MQPRPNVAFCPVCRTPKQPNEVACNQCGTRSCPSGHVIDSRICRLCGYEDRSWKPQAKAPSLEATIQRSQGIPEVTERVCPRCNVKSIFTYGHCHNCGFTLETQQSGGTQQETGMIAPAADSQFSPGVQHYVVQQQFPGTHDAKLAYICPRCGARADPRTGSCYNCGYIGSLAYEMPKQQSPAGGPPPPAAAPAKAFIKQQVPSGQQFSHPPEPSRACPSCGASVPADSRFCRQCGFRSGSSRHIAQGYNTGAAEKVRSSAPMGMSQMTPAMQAMPADGMVQDLMGTYPQAVEMPYPGEEYPEKRGKGKEKKEKRYPQERKTFPMGLLTAIFVVAAALVAMVMFTVSQILAPAPPPVTPTVDKTPPEITQVAIASVTASSATIEWTTNEKATSQVMLCDPSGVCTWTEPDASLMKSHSVLIKNSKLNIKYHITVKSIDASGNEGTYEMEEAFTQGSQPPTTPPPATVPEGIEVGKRAFNFTLKNLQGADVSLISQRGKVVMVNFWAVTCGPCIAELPYIEELYKARSGQLAVLAINEGETKATVQSFINSTNYTLTVLLDTEATARSIYNVTSWPVTFFIDSTGVIKQIKVGSFANKAEIETILSSMQ